MIEQELSSARRAFESWSGLTATMIADGSLPGRPDDQQKLRAILEGPDRRIAWGIFLAGFMSVEED